MLIDRFNLQIVLKIKIHDPVFPKKKKNQAERFRLKSDEVQCRDFSSRGDGNRTLIFKKAKLQEARGQIGCAGAVSRAVGKHSPQGLECAPVHLQPRRAGLAPRPQKRRRDARLPGARAVFVSEQKDFSAGPSCCALYSIRREIVTNDIVRPT